MRRASVSIPKMSPPVTRWMPVARRSAEYVLPLPDGPTSPASNGTRSRTAGMSMNDRVGVFMCYLPLSCGETRCDAARGAAWRCGAVMLEPKSLDRLRDRQLAGSSAANLLDFLDRLVARHVGDHCVDRDERSVPDL